MAGDKLPWKAQRLIHPATAPASGTRRWKPSARLVLRLAQASRGCPLPPCGMRVSAPQGVGQALSQDALMTNRAV